MVDQFESTGHSQVAIEPVDQKLATRYGVCGGEVKSDGIYSLDCMIEKPSVDEIPIMKEVDGLILPDAYAFAARYLLTANIFTVLRSVGTGRNGEIQLTDAMAAVLGSSGFGGVQIPGKRVDVGTPSTITL